MGYDDLIEYLDDIFQESDSKYLRAYAFNMALFVSTLKSTRKTEELTFVLELMGKITAVVQRHHDKYDFVAFDFYALIEDIEYMTHLLDALPYQLKMGPVFAADVNQYLCGKAAIQMRTEQVWQLVLLSDQQVSKKVLSAI